jgi:sulfide:quinone oxidoreductase
VGGALTFRGPQDGGALASLLKRATLGDVQHVTYGLASGSTWPLPLYELALMTQTYFTDHLTQRDVTIVTPEDHPLAMFGPPASSAVAELLELRAIAVEHGVTPVEWRDGQLHVVPERRLETDAVVALPRLEGPALPGVPQDESGFVATDEYGWVLGLNDVYAAGDMTQFPLKQGGIATQQADAVASVIAADAGASVRPHEFRPVLRGLLLTGFVPRFLRADANGAGSTVDTEPLWWPPAKIVGRYLAPFLAKHLGLARSLPEELRTEHVPVDVELDRADGRPLWSRV